MFDIWNNIWYNKYIGPGRPWAIITVIQFPSTLFSSTVQGRICSLILSTSTRQPRVPTFSRLV